MTDKSREPISENCNVRGIGVAVSVSVSTFTLSEVSFSLAATPNFCSSSIMSSPKSRNSICLPSILCVPMRISIFPALTSSAISRVCFVLRERLIYSTLIGKSFSRSINER